MHNLGRILAIIGLLLPLAYAGAIEPTAKDVVYAKVGERKLLLDIYQPTQKIHATAPLVVWVHGGAWRSGSKEGVPVTRWLEHGWAIASIDYRLSPEARFPAQMHDIKAAVRYLRASADKYGFDVDRLIVAGASAGGHLAALAGVSAGVQELEGSVGEHPKTDSGVQAIVSFFGASNLESILAQSTEHGLSVRVPALKLLLGGVPEQKPELARLASPLAHLDRADPPLWLIHGDADPQMPFEQSRELQAAYAKLGLQVKLDVIPGGKHGGAEFYADERLDRLASEIERALAQ